MVSATFLEKLYLGTLDESTLGSLEAEQDLDRVERIVDGFREILRDYPPEDVEMKARLPEGMLKRMGEAGLFGLSIPAEYGGLGLNVWEYMRVIERIVGLDISAAMASLAHLSIGSKGIVLFGNEAQKRKYLTPAASGETIFSYALT
ncbi:MAG: acyl-CoA dehydrogenase family protein, partial [Acidobacteriota bacterium]